MAQAHIGQSVHVEEEEEEEVVVEEEEQERGALIWVGLAASSI